MEQDDKKRRALVLGLLALLVACGISLFVNNFFVEFLPGAAQAVIWLLLLATIVMSFIAGKALEVIRRMRSSKK